MWRDPSPHEVTINKTETGNYSLYDFKYSAHNINDATTMILFHTLIFIKDLVSIFEDKYVKGVS